MDPLRARAAAALADPVLQRALPMATRRATLKQEQAWRESGVADALRARAAALKAHTLEHLDEYLERFEEQATANGIHVHWASTRADALRTIDGLLDAHGVRSVVKAKSMTTEELGLTQHLTRRGIETWETDLGEFIVQLSGRPPSHITAPAIHEDTASISALFAAHLGTPPSDDPRALTAHARAALRPRFLEADCGISGANLLVAETGRLVLVENEGNIRLCTTLPRVHIAVAGIEKVVPREADVPVFLKLLARSATGQKLTTYTQGLRGPRRAGETEGADVVHVVLLDAGRSELLADAVARPALGCIRCGSCLNVCPVYRGVGGHAYGSVYPGPIGAITTPWLSPGAESARLPYASTLCGACEEACPVRIPIPEILLHLRARAVGSSHGVRAALERRFVAAWRRSVMDEGRFARAGRAGRLALSGARGETVERLPPPLSGWTQHRRFPKPARVPFRARWGGKAHKEGER